MIGSKVIAHMSERVLLVEDDARLADMLSEYLGQAGFRITIAAQGAAAIAMLSQNPRMSDTSLPPIPDPMVANRLLAPGAPEPLPAILGCG